MRRCKAVLFMVGSAGLQGVFLVSQPQAERWSGLIVVDKPLGLSSMDVVRRVRRSASRGQRIKKTKCGHAGTLDPLATGVVVCCIGQATKAVDGLMGLTKVYEAEVDLSAFTTTDDREGPRTEVDGATPPTREAVERACAGFVGEEVEQVPPAFSAIHVDGRRAYELARSGEDVKMRPRLVRIDAVELLGYVWPVATVRVTCGKGTYIRSLGRDLGVALGTGGHLASLRRTAVGPYRVEDAVAIERFETALTAVELLTVPIRNV
ncbi:MAG: tRNA pseudouridine(55) synthase TruB [Planctomycetota bacterium]